MMKLKFTGFYVLILAALLLGACTPQKSITDSQWVLAELNGQPVLDNATVTLNFEGNKLNGTDGCNQYGGEYTAKNGAFDITRELESTLMACEEPVMQQASAYYDGLRGTTQYQLDAQELRLLDPQGEVLAVFTLQN